VRINAQGDSLVTSALLDTLAHNLDAVCARIRAACERSDRAVNDVTLVAVTKSAEPAWIEGLYGLGCRDFGESRPQQLVQRASQFPRDVRWHLIGHLQRNKAALVLPIAAWLHSIDSLRLIEKLHDLAKTSEQQQPLLLEVNVSGEAAKDGFAPEELRAAWSQWNGKPPLPISGLMTMAPLSDDPETARQVFRRLRQLRDELSTSSLPLLSMGMSGDFEVAIEEGATLVRIGSALFEGLT